MMENETAHFTVSQVAELTGATAAQLKNWDKTGLLVAQRTGDGIANNRKLYTQDDVDLVREILLYRSLGFGLGEIRKMLDASPEERSRLVSERASMLKLEFTTIKKKIELTSALEEFTPETLLSELDCDDALSACEEYSKDENLRMMVRWLRSHTQQDVDALRRDLADALEDFEALGKDAPWKDVAMTLLRFCDVWSKPFGWPTVGQMLGFALLFQELADDSEGGDAEIQELFDQETLVELSQIFLLAWADNALRVLDDILASTYCGIYSPDGILAAKDLPELLCIFVCEAGNRPHLYKGETPPQHPDELERVADLVFALLEDAILDGELGEYLDIETLFTIDQESLEFAQQLAKVFARDRKDEWVRSHGYSRLAVLVDQWLELLREQWRLTEGSANADIDEKAFIPWLHEHYSRVLADPPMARWITEEEAVEHERKMRALAQEAASGQGFGADAGNVSNRAL